jgi:hypothetical protein
MLNQLACGGGAKPPGATRVASYTSRDASRSNGIAAFAERPMCEGSSMASITPVTVASTELPMRRFLPIASSEPNSFAAYSRVSTTLRGGASADRASPATNGKSKISRNSGSTATPNSRSARSP